jgi:AcrR family transcriptional regulator
MAVRHSQSDVRRERAREHARRDILLAAAGVFARRGYAASTLQELAEAAGFAAPSLYRYFESKEEIFRSLVDLVVHEMDATFEAPVDRALPLGARLEILLMAQDRIAEELQPAVDLLQHPGPELPVTPHPVHSAHAGLAYYEARFLAWLRKNTSASELRLPVELAARAFTGIAFAFGGCAEGPRVADPARARTVVDLALQGLAAPAERRRGVA